MSERRAVRMHYDDAASLGRLRRRSGIEVCERRDALWLRVQAITDELDAAIRTLPGTRFTLLADGQLVHFGTLVPKGHLPNGPWIDLAQWMIVQAESAAFSGKIRGKIELRLVRGGPTCESNVIVTPIDTWQEYVANAPQIRLDRWAFAMNGDGQVVVRGTPLPPVKGVRFVERAGVAVEAGWTWTPSVDPDVLSEILALASDDLALLHAAGRWDHIQSDDFVRATRSAVRLSIEALTHD